jgi:hypothetical protein
MQIMVKPLSILSAFYSACVLQRDLLWHDIDRIVSLTKVRLSSSENYKKSVIKKYNLRLAERFTQSLDAGSRATEIANGFSKGTVIDRRRRATRDLSNSIKCSRHI